jgi:hypothetical protein
MIGKKRSLVPIEDNCCKFVKWQKHKGSRILNLNLEPSTPHTLIQKEQWSFKWEKNGKDRIRAEFICNQFTDAYLDWFWFELRSGSLGPVEDILKLFPNIKEQTESVGMLWALSTHGEVGSNALIVVVADGNTPRTATILAKKYQFAQIYSIDPAMKDLEMNVPNLHLVPHCVEDWTSTFPIPNNITDVAIIAPHSHVDLFSYLEPLLQHNQHISALPMTVIALPCCAPQCLNSDQEKELDLILAHEYVDWDIHSEKNVVKVWQRKSNLGGSPRKDICER